MNAYEIAGLAYLIGGMITVGVIILLKIINNKRSNKNQEGNDSDNN